MTIGLKTTSSRLETTVKDFLASLDSSVKDSRMELALSIQHQVSVSIHFKTFVTSNTRMETHLEVSVRNRITPLNQFIHGNDVLLQEIVDSVRISRPDLKLVHKVSHHG